MGAKMNVRTLCLAILHDGDATGYEIRKQSTEGDYAYFVEASFGSIYPALAKLEHDGLVVSAVEQQDGRPAKKVYSITELGRTTFINALFDDIGHDVFRSEFLLFARFAASLPRSLVETRLHERIEALTEKLSELDKIGERCTAKADDWVLNYARANLTVARSHIETHMNELIALARPDDAAKAAE